MRILATVFVAALALAQAAQPADLRPEASFETSLVRQINAVRQTRGLRPFAVSAKLNAAATEHSREMGTYGYFEHESPDQSPFWKRVEQWYPSSGWRAWSVGENILYSSPDLSARDAVSSWMASPPHRANLLSRNWREIGVAAAHFASAPGTYGDRPVTVVTADFGTRR